MLDFLTQYAHSWETICEALVANEQTLCFQAGFAPRAPTQVAPPAAASVLSVARLVEAFVETRRTGHERPQPAAFEDHNGVVVPPSESASVAGGISSSLSNPNWNPPGAQTESVASSILHPTVSPAASANPAPKTGAVTVTATVTPSAKGAQANVPNSNSLYNLLVQPEPPPTTVAQPSSNSSKFSAILQLYNKSSATQSKAPSSVSPAAGAESKSPAVSESSSLSTKTLATWPSVPNEAATGGSALAGAKEANPSGRSASIDKHPIILLAAQHTGPPTVPASAAPAWQQQPPPSSSSLISSFLRFPSVSDLFRGGTHSNAQQPAAAANAEQLQQQQQQQRVVEQQQLQQAQQQTSDENTAATGASQASRGSGHFEKHEPEKNKRREGTRSLVLLHSTRRRALRHLLV